MFESEEPTEASRTAAKALRDMFIALVKEGFSEDQALAMLGNVLVSVAIGNMGNTE